MEGITPEQRVEALEVINREPVSEPEQCENYIGHPQASVTDVEAFDRCENDADVVVTLDSEHEDEPITVKMCEDCANTGPRA